MMTLTIKETQAQLNDLIHRPAPCEEVIITENQIPVARLSPALTAPPRKHRQLGTLKGSVLYMATDFDSPLDDFKDDTE